ncbi:Lysine--tRNA ligase [bioreactor metagenome]|uniref:Lysine--tRNA ligase n=1 Tax=bioreactor metagenome TaxID=1076179 RepID=A0A644T8C2_9ZZZZ|nr:amino acid--tRNA ligase-related protein [Candidatus Elulimicrobiales bacterium]
MTSILELKEERFKKLEKLKEKGFDPFIAHSNRNISIKDYLKDFENIETAILAGRVMSSRGQGNLIFFDIFDGSSELNENSKVQAIIKNPESPIEAFNFYKEFVDIGDFVEIEGEKFLSKTGQRSILVKSVKMLTKSLLPLPDKYHGLQDEELKMRYRYLDILTNSELRELFFKKAKFWNVIREFLTNKGMLEVETPTIENTTGGAEARPFKTYHNDFDMEVYMRICVGELWQKRLMAAGYCGTFEIGRAYRNEGSSPEHLQEFTNCEFYLPYADYRDGMKLVKELYIKIANEVFGKTEFEMKGFTFDLSSEWVEIDYAQEIEKQTSINIWEASDTEIKDKLEELKVKYDGENRERLLDTLWKYCRKNISGPAFLVNPPLLVAPLAKPNPDGKTAQMFQPILAGSEIGRGYSELNNPIIQRENFEKQKELLEKGDEEAMMPDWDFVEMLEHGMPPTCGFGFGDRLFAFLAGLPLRETIMFPLIKEKK